MFVCMLVSPVFHNSTCHVISKVQADQAKTKQRKQKTLLGKVHVKDIVMKFNNQKNPNKPKTSKNNPNKQRKQRLFDRYY